MKCFQRVFGWLPHAALSDVLAEVRVHRAGEWDEREARGSHSGPGHCVTHMA